MKRVIAVFFLFISVVQATELQYRFGRGLSIDNRFYLGGYTSLQYEYRENGYYEYKVDDLAVLGFLRFNKFKIFGELEARNWYYKSKNTDGEFNLKLHTERIYLQYDFNEHLKIRGGRFITPLGIWNQVHINALKWTTSDPVTAVWFYPWFSTGLDIFGFLPVLSENTEYHFFIQKTKNIDHEYNNVKSDDFIGFQFKKYFDVNRYAGFNGGRFYDTDLRETTTFVGFFGYLNIKRFYLMGEAYLAHENEEHHTSYSSRIDKESYYLQMVYRVFSRNYLILRNEYFNDRSDNGYLHVWTIGWNYKPRFNISLKGEFQIFEKRANRFLTSFAVLF
ncbi:hypothetical protein [Persephonella sp.]